MRSRRVVFTAPGKVSIEPFELEEPAADEVLLETLHTTISPGTERAHLHAEENTVTRDRGFPFYPGYSNIGRIVRVGAGVKNYRPGQVVATSLPHVSHAVLPAAPSGAAAHRRPVAPPEASFGGSPLIWPLQEGLDDQRLKECSTYCFSRVALHGVRRARIELGEAVVILGLGPIGLQCVQYARLSGGFPVVGIDPLPARRRVAITVGADAAYADGSELTGDEALVRGGAPAVVIEATGLPDVIPQAFKLCGRNGRVMLLGSTRGLTNNVNFYTDVHKKGLTVVGVHAGTRPRFESTAGHWTMADEVALILKLIGTGRVQCGPLVTHEFPIERVAEAYETVRSPESLAVVLNWKA